MSQADPIRTDARVEAVLPADPPQEAKTGLPLIGSTWARRWLLALAILATVGLAFLLRGVLIPLLLSFVLAYALDPVVDRLVKFRIPRAIAAISVVVGLLLLLAGVLVVVVPAFVDQFTEATADLPRKVVALRNRLEPWLWANLHVRVPPTPGEMALRAVEELRARGLDVVDGVRRAVFGTLNAIVVSLGALIIPVFSVYLLIDFDSVVSRAAKLVPLRFYPGVARIAADIHKTLARYIRGQITANLVLATLYATGLYLVGLPMGVPIGILTGLFAFVPYIGFGVGFTLAVLLALLEWQGVLHLVGVIAVMGGVQILDALWVTPRIVGGAVGLKPIEVLLTMMATATLFGFVGVLLAVPIGAVVKILLHHAVQAYLQSNYYRQPPASGEVPVSPASSEGAG